MPAASMSKENVFSTVRALFIFGGTFLMGHNLLGHPLDAQTWQTITGAVIALGMAVWGIKTKDTSIEGIESFLRSFVQGIGGLLVAYGTLGGATLNSILGLLAAITPLLQSFVSKAKAAEIVAGTVIPVVDTQGKSTGMLKTQVPPKPDPVVEVQPVKEIKTEKPDPKPDQKPNQWWSGRP